MGSPTHKNVGARGLLLFPVLATRSPRTGIDPLFAAADLWLTPVPVSDAGSSSPCENAALTHQRLVQDVAGVAGAHQTRRHFRSERRARRGSVRDLKTGCYLLDRDGYQPLRRSRLFGRTSWAQRSLTESPGLDWGKQA
jgi:hypothetical protein